MPKKREQPAYPAMTEEGHFTRSEIIIRSDLPLVTIGMAVYNGGDDLRVALASISAQDYPHLEIIICDDGSTDGSIEQVEAFEASHPVCRVFRNQTQLGIIGNYNQLIELARGKYLVFADQDDRREPTFVSRCVEKLEDDPSAVLCHSHTGVVWPGMNGTLYHVNTLNSQEGATSVTSRYWRFLRHYSDTTIYGLIRVKALRETRGWQQGFGSSNRLLFELLLIGTFSQVPQTLYWYTAKGLRHRLSPADEYKRGSGGREMPRYTLPFLDVAWAQANDIMRSTRRVTEKIALVALLATHVAIVNVAKTIHRVLDSVTRGHTPSVIERYCAKLVYSTTDLTFVISPEDDRDYYPNKWPLHR